NFSALGDINWYSKGQRRPQLGMLCLIFGAVAIPLYFSCALAMFSMRNLSAYKIMLCLAFVDILELCFASIGFGIMSIKGEVYCTHPKLQLLYSLGLECCFFCSTMSCALLALNRFGEMLFIRSIVWLFKVFLMFAISFKIQFRVQERVLFTPPMLFNSKHHMLFFDPMIYEGKFQYDSYIHFGCVVTLPIISLLLYLLMLFGLLCKYGSISKMQNSNSLSRATYQIFVQSGVIILIHLTSMLTFQILQFIPANAIDTMLYVAHVGWMLVHGTPSLIYLAVNDTIR
ncbi:hypothetical protein PENTCL1PPCAC_16638, partial [Pristionchus entomophagus]